MSETVKVVVRCRPFTTSEIESGYQNIVDTRQVDNLISIFCPGEANCASQDFSFDAVYGEDCSQYDLYRDCAQSIVDDVLQGYNATIFAYGQTGTGKTYTMLGKEGEEQGIMPRVFSDIFDTIRSSDDAEYLVRASYLELYNENLYDLLDKRHDKKLAMKENRDHEVYVKGLRTIVIESEADLNKVLRVGCKNRSVGRTVMNQDSSRSHSIFTTTIEFRDTSRTIQGEVRIRSGKLHLVDLAGSERQSKTGSAGARFKEAANINLSLSCLGKVINALSDNQQRKHIPFRDSKLTRLLQDSLGGNSKTVMLANIGPADYNYEETLHTLRYTARAKRIKNKPRINEDPQDTIIRSFRRELDSLKAQLAAMDGEPGEGSSDADGGNIKRGYLESSTTTSSSRQSTRTHLQESMNKLIEEKEATEACVEATLDSLEQLEQKKHRQREEACRIGDEKNLLEQRIKNMEQKLLKGGKRGGMSAMASKKELKLQRKQALLSEKVESEKHKDREIVELENNSLKIEKESTELQERIHDTTRDLEKAVIEYQALSKEVDDYFHQTMDQRQKYSETIHSTEKQLLLKYTIITAFIPESHQRKRM